MGAVPPNAPARSADWRGAIALARDATTGLASLVEAMHSQIARPLSMRPRAGDAARAGGVAGLVYASVRGVTRLVGAGADVVAGATAALAPRRTEAAPSADREAVVAALNGVLGDRLELSANPLAITMALRSRGRVLRLEQASLAAALGPVGPKLLVLVHGLCMNDLRWEREGHDHGAALARDLGYTPVYLHYNSGRHISTNGRDFAALMQALVSHWPLPLQELSVLSHSMGGLVARSACAYGAEGGMSWVQSLDRLACLGTPHHGAPLERGGHWVSDLLLGASKFSAPLVRLGQLRSAGITDLRHGNVRDADWAGRDRFAPGADTRQPLPLPASVACYAVAALAGERAHVGDLRSRLIGDGLVPLRSALGEHDDARFRLAFAPQRQWVAEGVNHLQLLSDRKVYAKLREWFGAPR